MSEMNAVRFHGQKDVRLEQIPIPKCGKGQVKVSTIPTNHHNGSMKEGHERHGSEFLTDTWDFDRLSQRSAASAALTCTNTWEATI